jgi:alpha-1,3-mannosyltransferase
MPDFLGASPIMRVVHVVRQFHPAIGGLEGVVKALATAQVANGHQVRVVTLDRIFNALTPIRLPSSEWLNGVEIVRVPYFGSQRYPIAFSAIRHIRDADIVHVHAIDFFFDYLAWTTPFHRRKLVVSTHGGFFHTGFAARLKRLYFDVITRLSLSWYAGVAAVGVADETLFRSIRPRGVCLIENGVDVDKYAGASSPTPNKALISIGRLSSNKGLDRVIGFLAALHRIDPEWSLTIAGRPWDVSAKSLTDLVKSLGLSGKVRLIESPSDTAVRKAITKCSAFISASSYEGFGLVLVEALSAGLWPVVSPIPTFKHLIKKADVGTVVDFKDTDAAARKFLADWSAVSKHYADHRRAAVAAAAAFNWSAVNDRYEKFYASVLGHDTRTILDVPILVKTSDEAIELLDRQVDRKAPAIVVFANAHTLNSTAVDRRVHSILDRSIVFNDGIGVDLASRILFGKAFPENLNGTDFIPHYLRNSKHRFRIFLLGGKPEVAFKAAGRLKRMAPQHDFVGSCHGYYSNDELPNIIAHIRRSHADILLVAMGNPRQEAWLSDHLKHTGCQLGFGVGGLFDFMAGAVPRAPQWARAIRIEWAYRLWQQPVRLWRRYLVQMPIFLMRVSRQWLAGARAPSVMSR